MHLDTLADLLASERILPALRLPDAPTALGQVARCVEAGLGIVEFTTTTLGWAQAVCEARQAWPSLVVGVGTVLDPGQAHTAVEAGAAFVVSPCPVPEVRAALDDRVPLIEGGFTPGELLAATSHGIGKLFPAHVGGPQMLRSVLALRPEARIVATGGIGLDQAQAWFDAGALAVGMGTAVTEAGDLAERVSILRATAGPRRF